MQALLQVNLYWIAFYACYALLLRRQTFFALNRAYLLGALLFSFGLPLLQFSGSVPGLASSPVPEAMYQLTALPLERAEMVVAQATAPAFVVVAQAEAADAPFPWLALLWAMYAAGAAFMLVRLLRQLWRLFSFLQKGERVEMEGYTLILSDESDSFSFLNWVVVNRRDYENDFDTVLRHELVHVRQRHSVDVLLVEVLRVIFWFNPVLILYKKSLQQVHEYLADAAAPQRDRYANFLLAYALHKPANTLTNNFLNSSHLKNRIKMLYKIRNSKWALGKYVAVLALVGFVVTLMAFKPVMVQDISAKTDTLTVPDEGVVEKLKSEVITATVGKPNLGQFIPIDFPDDILTQKAPETFNLYLLNKNATQENTTVKGTVKSGQNGQPLPGTVVLVVGTNQGTSTDAEGNFKLENFSMNSSLAISHVGYVTQQRKITTKDQVLNVTMRRDKYTLDEIVVVGYLPKKTSRIDSSGGRSPLDKSGEYRVVEQLPEFPGGRQEMYKFLGRSIRYPAEAQKKGIEGRVLVNFLVSEDGHIRNPQIAQSLGGGIDEEALRVVLNMPTWTPAKQNGRPVAMEYVLPIDFQLDKPEVEEDKEKRQGKTNNFRSSRMALPDFKFEDAIDFGIRSGGGPNNFGMKEVPMPGSSYSKLRSPAHFNAEPMIIKIEKYSIRNDSVKPTRFLNYHNPHIQSKN